MNITSQYIAISKLDSILLEYSDSLTLRNRNSILVASFNAELMALGYTLSKTAYSALQRESDESISALAKDVISSIREIKGSNVKHTPMYPNFPKQVMEMSNAELYYNALLHYWTSGQWSPQYATESRPFEFDTLKFKELSIIHKSEFNQFFKTLASSNDSISESDVNILKWYLDNAEVTLPNDIPNKEILSIFIVEHINRGIDISPLITNSTDVLRAATYMSGGKPDLVEDVKFISFPRKTRKALVKALERVINEDDINRHKNKWIRLFHSLHVGEYSKVVFNIANKFRNNEQLNTVNSRVEDLLRAKATDKSVKTIIKVLSTRPGEFARRLDHVLRWAGHSNNSIVIDAFSGVAGGVSTRVLMQLLGHFKNRSSKRIVFSKSVSINSSKVLSSHKIQVDSNRILDAINLELQKRFSKLEPLETVYIDPYLMGCPIPSGQRSASGGYGTVARGTRMPICDDKKTLRFFIYWKGRDIDLSASFHDKDFKMINSVSYSNLRSSSVSAYHSGDIVHAENGASEFIDINLDTIKDPRVKYISMTVNVFNGPTFKEHEECFVGWMERSSPNSNEIFDPKTVKAKIDMTSNSKTCIPVIFDVETREAIWVDMISTSYHMYNNVKSNRASIEDVLQYITALDCKSTLYDLFNLHATARNATIVTDPAIASTVFSIDSGITPYHINDINSNWMK